PARLFPRGREARARYRCRATRWVTACVTRRRASRPARASGRGSRMAGTIATSTAVDLSRLPPPDVVQALDYETILAELQVDLAARLPDFDAFLESDPAIKLLEIVAYRELLLRQRVND